MRNLFLALMLLPVGPAGAGPRDVAVLVRFEVPVYARFADRFARACDCRVRIIRLGDDPAAAAREVRAAEPGAVMAVGRSGLRAAIDHLGDLPLVHGMVVNPWTVMPRGHAGAASAPLNISPSHALTVLRRLSPGVRKVGVIHDPSLTGPAAAEARRAATAMGMALEVREAGDVAAALKAVDELLTISDAILLLPDRTVGRPEVIDHLLLKSLEQRVPVVGLAEKHVRRGALFALSITVDDLAVEAARLAERVLAGERPPGKDPMRRKTTLHLNLRTADRLGLTVPPDVRREAAVLLR
jgi:putative ABC transport system substrate-binding protein